VGYAELPSFDLVVASVDRTEELERLFESLERQAHPAFRVLLVDQNEDGRLEEIIGRQTPGKTSKTGPPPTDPADFYDPNLPFVETHEEARHFKLGPQVAEHQVRPWREPIPAPA